MQMDGLERGRKRKLCRIFSFESRGQIDVIYLESMNGCYLYTETFSFTVPLKFTK